jgi:hypothetical protein
MTDFAQSTSKPDFAFASPARLGRGLVALARLGTYQGPLVADTKLAAQGQWEASQTLPLLATLVVAGASAVLSQIGLDGGPGSPVGIAVFGVCLVLVVKRVGRSYRDVFIGAEMANGLSRDEAEADYQSRYAD